jgi:hypothetical protein
MFQSDGPDVKKLIDIFFMHARTSIHIINLFWPSLFVGGGPDVWGGVQACGCVWNGMLVCMCICVYLCIGHMMSGEVSKLVEVFGTVCLCVCMCVCMY